MDLIGAPRPKSKTSSGTGSAKRKLPPWLARKIFAGKKKKS
jgi:hypothetical protein